MNNNPNWNNQPNNHNNQTQEQPSSPNQPPNNQVNQQPSALMQIVGVVLPSLIEHFTGQKMTPGGNGGETQLILTQLLGIQQQMISNLHALNNRLVNLENNATQQLTNLTNQVQSIKSIRLSQEKKQIDFNLQPENEPNKY